MPTKWPYTPAASGSEAGFDINERLLDRSPHALQHCDKWNRNHRSHDGVLDRCCALFITAERPQKHTHGTLHSCGLFLVRRYCLALVTGSSGL